MWNVSATVLAKHAELLHLQVQAVTSRRPWIGPRAPLLMAVVVELLALVIDMLRPGLELLLRLALGLLALGPERHELYHLLLLREPAAAELGDRLVEVPMRLLEGMRPRAFPSPRVVVEDTIGVIVVLRPVGGQRRVERLVCNPHEVMVGNGIDAEVSRVSDELRSRRLQALFPAPLRARDELVDSELLAVSAALRVRGLFAGSIVRHLFGC
mmetsp:Transcript_62715/g.176874  ORF Transcript_62715/g.176874 Transcript_62715/m.176874 type:complete len:212 (-) Transcript_62715:141-776(-)